MFLGITINMKVVFGSFSENCDRSLSDLARFSLISDRSRFSGGFTLSSLAEDA